MTGGVLQARHVFRFVIYVHKKTCETSSKLSLPSSTPLLYTCHSFSFPYLNPFFKLQQPRKRKVITNIFQQNMSTQSMKQKLLVTEGNIVRIFGPSTDVDDTLRIKTNELNNLIRNNRST